MIQVYIPVSCGPVSKLSKGATATNPIPLLHFYTQADQHMCKRNVSGNIGPAPGPPSSLASVPPPGLAPGLPPAPTPFRQGTGSLDMCFRIDLHPLSPVTTETKHTLLMAIMALAYHGPRPHPRAEQYKLKTPAQTLSCRPTN